jgi:hypothetical protein
MNDYYKKKVLAIYPKVNIDLAIKGANGQWDNNYHIVTHNINPDDKFVSEGFGKTVWCEELIWHYLWLQHERLILVLLRK